MTGCVFIGLSIHIKGLHLHACLPHLLPSNNGKRTINGFGAEIRSAYGRNKLYQLSLFTLDLEELGVESDPLQHGMSLNSSFRVSGIDPSISTRDIVRCMNDLIDSDGRRVNFDIVWVDDTTFIVAARFISSEGNAAATAAGGDTDILREHGQMINRALRNRFHREEIESLEEYFYKERMQKTTSATYGGGVEEESPGWIDRLLTMVGIKKRKATVHDDTNNGGTSQPALKRRRQS